MSNSIYMSLVRETAREHGLNPALVCAIIEHESAWDTYAIRYEHEFFAKYILPKIARDEIADGTEAEARAISWGLMQIMGETARELGFTGKYLAELCAPGYGVELGCMYLGECIRKEGGDVARGLQRYNGGGNPNYAAAVMALMPKYTEADE